MSGPATGTQLELGRARVLFSTRRGGVSGGPYESLNLGILTGDDPERVRENRARVAGAAGIDPQRVAMGWQVHGAELREWPGAPLGGEGAFGRPGAVLPRVDGHVTDRAEVGLAVLAADCLPVALAGGGLVGMVHCGWRGLADGILERALARFPEPPSAAVGPGIGPCCYEVGEHVVAAFDDLDGVAEDRRLDLRAIVARKLEAGGVSEVQHVDHCTSCHPELYFSHRRDGGVTGRQGGIVWRPP
jgi:YfiH family protein